jgi:hypothetical protein
MSLVRITKGAVEVTGDAEEEIASAHPPAREETLINLECERVEPEENSGRISKAIPADTSLIDIWFQQLILDFNTYDITYYAAWAVGSHLIHLFH